MASSPAFSFYAKDFLTGTATMSLAEVGAYVKFLAYQWDAGSVPSAAKERARILGCTAAEERRIWARLVSKFVFAEETGFQNARLEDERRKQADRRQKLAANGSKGGSQKVANATERLLAKEQQLGGQESSLSSSSSFSGSGIETGSSTTKHRSVGVIVGPAEYVRLQEVNAFVGAKLRVPHKLHRELLGKSGANADVELQAWYGQLDAQLEESGKGTGDIFEWLRPRHQSFAKLKGWIEDAPKAAAAPIRIQDILNRQAGVK